MKKPASFQTATTRDAGERGALVAQPVVRRQAQRAGDLLQQAVLRRVEEQPDVGHRDHRQHGGREVGHAQEGAAGDALVDPQRHHQRQADRQRDGGAGEPQVVVHAPSRTPGRRPSPGSSPAPTHTPGRLPLGVEKKLSISVATAGQCVNATSSTSAGSSSSHAWMAAWLRARPRCDPALRPSTGLGARVTCVTCTSAACGRPRVCASCIACAGVLVPVSAACRPSFSALVTRWLSWVENSATENGSWSRATSAAGKSRPYLRSASVS